MRYMILLLTIIFSSYFSFGQDPSVFTWSSHRVDSTTKLMHKIKYSERRVGRRGLVYLKYVFEPEGNLLGVIYTYRGTKLTFITPFFLSTQNFVDQVQVKIEQDKSIKILYKTEYEMVIYNSAKKIYTVLYIDKEQGLLFMCHSLENPMEKVVIKKSI